MGCNNTFYKGFVMIFNVDKTAEQYEDVKLFGNGDVGLLDTVNKRFPKIFDLYKEMKQIS